MQRHVICCFFVSPSVTLPYASNERGTNILKGVRKFCNTFLVHRLAELDEIWHNEGHLWFAGLEGFWWTLVHFSGEQTFLTLDISHTSCQSAMKFGTVRGLASQHFFQFFEFGELLSGGPAIPCVDMHQSFSDAHVIFWIAASRFALWMVKYFDW